MYHLQVHTNQDIKEIQIKIRTQQYHQRNTGAKEIQQFNPSGTDQRHGIRPQPSHLYISL